MKAKINYRSKRAIMIILIAAVLLIAAIWGTVAFVRGNKNASAASPENNFSTSQADETNTGSDSNNSQGNNNDQNSNPSVLPNTGDDESSNSTGANNNNGTNSNHSNSTNNTSNSNNSGTGTSTETTTTDNFQNVPNQEYTQTTVIPGRENVLEYQNTQIGWNPIEIEADTFASELKIYRPIITGEKKVNKEKAKAGEELTYTITLNNTGNAIGKATVVDPIPEGTTLVDASNENYDKESNSMVWNVELNAGDKIELTFVVRIDEQTNTAIKNVATIDGEEIPEKPTTDVAHITTTKTSEASKTPLHELDTITYTLAATNDGTGTGIVKISDTVPVGTSLDGSIKLGNVEYTEKELKDGINVELNAGETKSIVFTVQVNPFDIGDENVVEKDGKTIRTIRNADATQDGKEITPTEDPVEKEYISITAKKEWQDANNKEGLRKDVTFRLYIGDKATEYTATASEDTDWVANFGNKFNKYDENKNEIKYTIKEETKLDKYKSNTQVVQNNGKITNELDFSKFTKQITVTKIWEDANSSKRPESIDIIFKGSDKSTKTEKLAKSEVARDSESIWRKTYELPKYDSNGNEITYTVEEENIDYYIQTSKEYNEDKTNVTITNAIPNLKIEKEVSTVNNKTVDKNYKVKAGDIVGYDITVTNIGTVKLENITVDDVMTNKGKIFTKYNDETSIAKDGIIVSNLALDVGKSKTYTVYYKVTSDDVKDASKTIDNTATATVIYKDENKKDRKITDSDIAKVAVKEETDISIKKEQKIGNVSVDKDGRTSDGKQVKVEPNTKITYTITVVNKGNTVQKDVIVSDAMTKESNNNYIIKSVKVNGTDRDYTKSGSDINIGDLKISEVAVITIEYTVTDDDMTETGGLIKNTVSVNKENKDGEIPTDEVKVPTDEWKADIDVVKSSKLYRNGKEISGPAMYGDTIKYTITATNKGKKDGTVKAEDTVPSGTELIRTADSTNLSKAELDALETEKGLSKMLDVKGNNGKTSIYFEVKVIAKAGTNIKNTAFIDDNTPKSDDGYDVEKKVAVNAKTTSMAEKNITIVLDLSSSMEYARWDYQNGKFVTRLDDAKSAIATFITDIYKKAENKNVEIKLVTFNYKDKQEAGQYYYEDYDSVIGTKLYATINANNYKTKIADINSIKLPNGSNGGLGTNISAGLNKANELTSGKKENNIVILLGDGDPTNEIDSKDKAEATANKLKEKATLYTISFGKGDTADPKFMKKIATDSDDKHAFTSSNASELSKNFDAIYNDEKDQYNDEKVLSNVGKVKLLIPDGMQLDIEKGIVIEVNGVKGSKITSLPSNELTIDKDGNIIWDISGYDANAALNIYYYLK